MKSLLALSGQAEDHVLMEEVHCPLKQSLGTELCPQWRLVGPFAVTSNSCTEGTCSDVGKALLE